MEAFPTKFVCAGPTSIGTTQIHKRDDVSWNVQGEMDSRRTLEDYKLD